MVEVQDKPNQKVPCPHKDLLIQDKFLAHYSEASMMRQLPWFHRKSATF